MANECEIATQRIAWKGLGHDCGQLTGRCHRSRFILQQLKAPSLLQNVSVQRHDQHLTIDKSLPQTKID